MNTTLRSIRNPPPHRSFNRYERGKTVVALVDFFVFQRKKKKKTCVKFARMSFVSFLSPHRLSSVRLAVFADRPSEAGEWPDAVLSSSSSARLLLFMCIDGMAERADSPTHSPSSRGGIDHPSPFSRDVVSRYITFALSVDLKSNYYQFHFERSRNVYIITGRFVVCRTEHSDSPGAALIKTRARPPPPF